MTNQAPKPVRGSTTLIDTNTVQQTTYAETAVVAAQRRASGLMLWSVVEAREREVNEAVAKRLREMTPADLALATCSQVALDAAFAEFWRATVLAYEAKALVKS